MHVSGILSIDPIREYLTVRYGSSYKLQLKVHISNVLLPRYPANFILNYCK